MVGDVGLFHLLAVIFFKGLTDKGLGGVDGHAHADVVNAGGAEHAGGIQLQRGDALQLAQDVEHAAAGVAAGDGRVHLNHLVGDHAAAAIAVAGVALHGAVEGGYDAQGDGAVIFLAQGVAHHDGPLAYLNLIAVAQLDGGQIQPGDKQHRYVKPFIGGNHGGLGLLAAVGDAQARGVLHHMVVGQHMAILADDHARAGAGQLLGSRLALAVVAKAITVHADGLVVVDAHHALAHLVGHGHEGAGHLRLVGGGVQQRVDFLLVDGAGKRRHGYRHHGYQRQDGCQ